MTSKFVGKFELVDSQLTKTVDSESIPPKTEWHNYAIWEFNGRRYRPITQKAIDSLEALVREYSSLGYTKAIKPGKRKPSSVKYAIQTYGVEDFQIVK